MDRPHSGEIAGAGGGREFLPGPGRDGGRHLAAKRGGRLHFDIADGRDLHRIVDPAGAAVVNGGEVLVLHAQAFQIGSAGHLVGRHDVGLRHPRLRRRHVGRGFGRIIDARIGGKIGVGWCEVTHAAAGQRGGRGADVDVRAQRENVVGAARWQDCREDDAQHGRSSPGSRCENGDPLADTR